MNLSSRRVSINRVKLTEKQRTDHVDGVFWNWPLEAIWNEQWKLWNGKISFDWWNIYLNCFNNSLVGTGNIALKATPMKAKTNIPTLNWAIFTECCWKVTDLCFKCHRENGENGQVYSDFGIIQWCVLIYARRNELSIRKHSA